VRGKTALDTVEGWGFDREEIRRLVPGSFVALNQETGGVLRGKVF
jgi:hypothetical protein